ncbi:MAG: YdcF family protein [Propionicimonas sp.]|uniref:YdcF family protein n=1 Tax=Propionicimonas sp. TaxID=1955623 RepID=UPI002B1F84BD|nr:YdcF family protein [Propionicimonas sp.]MEA4944428.1 YdcF family protein [Propionicimonas sp.]MEA5054495.1 YdcF family protein [Propionicimonas sp.]MEA5118063.1 YdcF family protein [Propionicimonas sp.]
MTVARGAVRLLALFAGLFLAADTVWMALTTNLNLGIVLAGAVAVACLVYAVVGKLSKLWSVNLIGLVLVGTIAGMVSWLANTGLHDTATGQEDALIVLGAAVHGREVSPALGRRLDVAVDFHARNPEAFIVVTGGQGPQEDVPEAVAGRDYLLARGVADDRILVEDRSTSTEENFRFGQAVLAPYWRPELKVAFVTNEFHVWRAQQLAWQAGLNATHLHADTLWYAQPPSYLRESVAVVQFVLTRD